MGKVTGDSRAPTTPAGKPNGLEHMPAREHGKYEISKEIKSGLNPELEQESKS